MHGYAELYCTFRLGHQFLSKIKTTLIRGNGSDGNKDLTQFLQNLSFFPFLGELKDTFCLQHNPFEMNLGKYDMCGASDYALDELSSVVRCS